MFLQLPWRFNLSIHFYRSNAGVIEEHLVTEGDGQAVMEDLKAKYKDDPAVHVRMQYMLRCNRDMVMAFRSVR